MLHEGIGEQLHRIGLLAAVAITAAAALATFAVLQRVMPISASARSSDTLTTLGQGIRPPVIQPATDGSASRTGNDPLAASWRRYEQTLVRNQRHSLRDARRRAAAVSRGLANASKRHLGFGSIPVIPGPLQGRGSTSRPGGTGQVSHPSTWRSGKTNTDRVSGSSSSRRPTK